MKGFSMKKLTLFACALLFCQSINAATPIDGWYSAAFGAFAYIPDNVNFPFVAPFHNNAHYHNGYAAGGRFGYKSGPMRYEGEVYYMKANSDRFFIGPILQTGVSGSSSALPVMANVYFDWDDLGHDLAPFIGGGIGYVHINTSLNSTGPAAITFYKGSNNKFAYQGTAGITYNFAENYSAGVSYRYFSSENAAQLGTRFQAHLGQFNVTYRFDEARYK
jgi:opacity protein-like surface antigen